MSEADRTRRPAAQRRVLTDPARYALQMVALLQGWGIEADRLLARAGLDDAFLERLRGDARLTMEQVEPLFGAARELCGRSDLGFEFGRALKPTAHGLLGFGLLGCADLDAAWRLAARQQHHLTEAFVLHYERRGSGGVVRFTPVVAMTEARLQFNLEVLAVSTLVTLQMLLGGRMPALDLRLSMPPPPHLARYLELAPARFAFDPGAPPGVAVAIDARTLTQPFPMAQPGVVSGVERHLRELAPAHAEGVAWAETVAQLLRRADGVQLAGKTVAARLGVSLRTLDRRLAGEGRSFASLRDDVMHERACRLLEAGEASVAQVAQRLGYRDAANFSRAFRRRAGMPPGEYRRARGTAV